MAKYAIMQVIAADVRDDQGDGCAAELARFQVEARGLHPLDDPPPCVTWEPVTEQTMARMSWWLYSADGVPLAEPGDWITTVEFHVTEEAPR
jgi:hypothetical protein